MTTTEWSRTAESVYSDSAAPSGATFPMVPQCGKRGGAVSGPTDHCAARPTSANPAQDCQYPDIVTQIVHTDAALASLHLARPGTQEKSLPAMTRDLAFDNDA